MNTLDIGTDIVSVERIKKIIKNKKDFEKRILSDREYSYCAKKKNRAEHVAGRFAAKEAVYKAVNGKLGEIALKDIEILSDGKSPRLSDNCLLGKKLKKSGLRCILSISHNSGHAVANSILLEDQT